MDILSLDSSSAVTTGQSRLDQVEDKLIFSGASVYIQKLLNNGEYELVLDEKVEGYKNDFHMSSMLILMKSQSGSTDFYVNVSQTSETEFSLYTGDTSQIISTKNTFGEQLKELLVSSGVNQVEKAA